MMNNKLLGSALATSLVALLAACPASRPASGLQAVENPVSEHVAPKPDTGSESPVFPAEEFRAQKPAPTAPRDLNLPEINQFKLGKDIDVYLVESHDLPTISIELNFDGGSVSDRKGHEGTAAHCMAMVSQGTQALDKLAFEEALADIASNVSSYAGVESQSVSMTSLSKNFEPTFALFKDSLVSPGFRSEELDRMIKRSLESLKQAKGSPGSVAARIVDGVLFGPTHPFGAITTEASLGKITIADCKRYHKSYVKPKGARLFIIGDMTKKQVIASFEPLLATWKGAPKKIAKISGPKSRKGRVFFVNIPGAQQSSIYVGHPGPTRLDPAFYANQMMTGVLGSGFSSRVNMNLREDKGYSYGARGDFNYNRHFGTFISKSSVRSDATRQSIEEILGEMTALKDGSRPAQAEELRREQNGAILGLPGRFATASQVLSMYRRAVYFGLPANYYRDYIKNFAAVSVDDVNQAAAGLLHPEDAIIIVVGDGSAKQIKRDDDGNDVPAMVGESQQTLKQSLEELAASELGGKGTLVVLDADGVVQK